MRRWLQMSGMVIGLLAAARPARAHIGPPFPIIENRKMGPCLVSLWTHPDIGTGTFFVFVQPAPGGSIPGDLKFNVAVQPESKRSPEASYAMTREDDHGQVEFKAAVDFDKDDFFRVRLTMLDGKDSQEAFSRVEATPTVFGRWDLLFYLLPFLAVGFLWLRGITRRRNRLKRLQAA